MKFSSGLYKKNKGLEKSRRTNNERRTLLIVANGLS